MLLQPQAFLLQEPTGESRFRIIPEEGSSTRQTKSSFLLLPEDNTDSIYKAMMQAGIGLAIGIPVAWMCARFVQSQLYNVGGHDAAVLGGAILVLAVAACTAGLIPARRAASTDPVKALRTE